MQEPSRRFLVLDTMRGYAACIVVVWHLNGIDPDRNGPLFGSVGYLAVDFFLLLSGFILNHAYFRHPTFSFSAFAKARFARLYPLHLITLLAMLLISTPVLSIPWKVVNDSDLWLHLLMIHNIGLGPDSLRFNGPAWSISVEFWTNLLVATLFVAAMRSALSAARRNVILLAAATIGYATLMISTGQLDVTTQNIAPGVNAGLVRGIASFCLGIVLYDAHRQFNEKAGPTARRVVAASTPICLLAFLFLFVLPIGRTLADFTLIPAFALILFVASFEFGQTSNLVAKAHYLGTISFSVYLIHKPIISLYQAVFGDVVYPLTYASIIIATLLAATVTHRFVEMPSYKWGKRAFDVITVRVMQVARGHS